MIIDSHCHAWKTWPYKPAVPDPESRGCVEQLLHEMDLNNVDKALIVCAQIDHNPKNNEYIASQVDKFPERLRMLVDLDSEWSTSYHSPGAVKRLLEMSDQWCISGFTHYLKPEDDGAWLYSKDGQELLRTAEEHSFIVSLSCYPHQQRTVRKIAEMFPSVPFLCHHLGFVGSTSGSPEENLNQVLLSAKLPNIFLKVSGFAYAAKNKWDYPYKDILWILEKEYESFGAERLCWGSDYPVVRFFMTYRQSLEVFRAQCNFLSIQEKELVLGKNLENIFQRMKEAK